MCLILLKGQRELRETKEGGWSFTSALENLHHDMKAFGFSIHQTVRSDSTETLSLVLQCEDLKLG